MADFLLISPDGEVTVTGREGYPGHVVGCHGWSGQNLWVTWEGIWTARTGLRMVGCDCALAMPEEHPENWAAFALFGALGHLQAYRGALAVYRVDWTNEPTVLRQEDVDRVRGAVDAVQAGRAAGTPLTLLMELDALTWRRGRREH